MQQTQMPAGRVDGGGIGCSGRTRPQTVLLSLLLGLTFFISSAGSAAIIGDTWTARNPLPTCGELKSICYGDGTYVAVGAGGAVLTSPDGEAWTPQSSGTAADLNKVNYVNGAFMAVGTDTTILTSADGVTWSSAADSIDEDHTFYSVAYGNDTYVVGTQNGALTSADGINWTFRSGWFSQEYHYFYDILYGGSKFVGTFGNSLVYTSADGITWSESSITLVIAKGVAYGNGTYVAVGRSSSSGGVICCSSNGTSWTQAFGVADVYMEDVAYADGKFVAVGYSGNDARLYTSADGSSWTAATIDDASYQFYQTVTYGDGKFVAVGMYGAVGTSDSGSVWTKRTSGVTMQSLRKVVYGNGIHVAVGSKGAIVTSTDGGTTWTAVDWSDTEDILDVAYGNGIFVASTSYAKGATLTSTDGITWTRRSSGLSAYLTALDYVNDRFIGCATGYNGIVVSSDGITWSTKTSSCAFLQIAYGNGLYVAQALKSGTHKICTSTDLNTWTEVYTGSTISFPVFFLTLHYYFDRIGIHGLAYGNGAFVCDSAAGFLVSTDANATSWTAVTDADGAPVDGVSIQTLNGEFVVASGYHHHSSSDGNTWETHTNGLGANVRSVCYHDGTYTAVGNNGAILQAGTSVTASYRSIATGNWSDTTTWEQSTDGTTWEPAAAAPGAGSLGTTIRNGHTVTVDANLTVADAAIETGGSLVVADSVTLTVSGALTNSGTVMGAVGSAVVFSGMDQTIPAGAYGSLQLSGSGIKTLDGAIDVNGDLTIDTGITLDVSGSNHGISVAGDWINSGTFTAQNGAVTLDGIAQSLTGSTTFYSLTKTVTAADTLTFAASSTTTITNTLTLQGADSQLLSLRSSSAGTQWEIDARGSRALGYLDVKDSNNTSGATMAVDASTDSGNNTDWYFIVSPTKVELTGPGLASIDTVSAAFTLESQTTGGIASAVEADTVFDLSSDSTGTATFYSDAAGTSAITQITIADGDSTATFYYKDSAVGSPTVTAAYASGGTDLGSDTHQVAVSDATTIFELGADGDVVQIEDVLGGDTNDNLTVTVVGLNLQFHDPDNELGAGPGATQVDAHTILVPIASIAGGFVFNGSGGDDVFVVDLADGNPIPAGGMTFAGGAGFDEIAISNGVATLVVFAFVSPSDGSVTIDGSIVNYTGLEPVTSTVTAANVTLDFTGGAETITVTDAGGGQTTVDSTLGETVTFNNPTATLTIEAGTGDDIINIVSLADNYPADVVINGGDAADTITVSGDISLAGDLTVTSADLTVADSRGLSVAGDGSFAGAVNLGPDSSLRIDGSGTFSGAVTLAGTDPLPARLLMGDPSVSTNTADLTFTGAVDWSYAVIYGVGTGQVLFNAGSTTTDLSNVVFYGGTDSGGSAYAVYSRAADVTWNNLSFDCSQTRTFDDSAPDPAKRTTVQITSGNILEIVDAQEDTSSTPVWMMGDTVEIETSGTINWNGSSSEQPLLTPAYGLVSSVGEAGTGGIVIAWTVDFESGVARYEVERRCDGIWVSVGSVAAHGAGKIYSITDPAGTSADRYRIISVDVTGFRQTFAAGENADGSKDWYLQLEPGWNMVSLPCIANDIGELESAVDSVLWSWDSETSSYALVEGIPPPLTGLWCLAPDSCEVRISGFEPETTTVHLEAGWNLFGPAENCPAPDGVETIWTWETTYRDILGDPDYPGLIQGKAYWFFASEPMDIGLPEREEQ